MAMTKPVNTVKDFVTFILYEADLTEKEVGYDMYVPKRSVPCSDLFWWIDYCPAGETEAHKDHISVFLCINEPVKATFTFAVDGFPISKTAIYEFPNAPHGYGFPKYASHEQLRHMFQDGKLTITCNVKFDLPAPTFSIPRIFQLFEHVPMDIEFAVGSERVPAHKSFLALISPVLQATFKHNGAEYQSDVIDITEFDLETVKAAIDICYGRESKTLSVETAVGILRFCDMYLITAVINELQDLSLLNPSVETFCTVVHYAYDCNKDKLLTTCYNFFKEHQDEIKVTEKFAKLPLTLVITVIKSAFGLKTDLEVLIHAKNNGIEFVANHLEKSLIGPITLENFSAVVTYAWDCSDEELKQDCAKYLNEHRNEVLNSEAYYKLPPTTAFDVLKASHDLKCGKKYIKYILGVPLQSD